MNNRTSKALLNFMPLSGGAISAFANVVTVAMKGNLYFTLAAPQLAMVVAAQGAYDTALAVASDGSSVLIAQKNVCKATLLLALKSLCNGVNFIAGGDRVKLLTSGFDISKTLTASSVLVAPTNVVLKQGDNTGELKIIVKGAKNYTSILFEYTLATTVANIVPADAVWVSQPSGKLRGTIANMPFGRVALVRIGLSGTRNQSLYTMPVATLVN